MRACGGGPEQGLPLRLVHAPGSATAPSRVAAKGNGSGRTESVTWRWRMVPWPGQRVRAQQEMMKASATCNRMMIRQFWTSSEPGTVGKTPRPIPAKGRNLRIAGWQFDQ